MKHLKIVALAALLMPAMAAAQWSTHGANGLPIPGATDHPGLAGIVTSGGKPVQAYYQKNQPVPGADDHPGMTGTVPSAGKPDQPYYTKDQPIPGAGDHAPLGRTRM
ncbi:hypothetical protein TVNIR_0999 [Thioalkalivibrio nitratireducens DSM 14787]|uniref:Uncharacterized protein n=1 Tax=Thioalkalivibrio nitratireducens (strain DSM 14787 / UNIQEM 213 / ALEN2) TaxID=1255043 RepID=L0DUH7_THIND|nr:hypothetical protein [Thioalkalivibrio nitratireducens]AGA32683.1 hypothetical protein TVNIR_0999 [Thioalkalivibrio nitratireducens DSM 14787]